MDAVTDKAPVWDPYNYELLRNPHDVFRRLRAQDPPLYHNEQYDFFAVSRYEDCIEGLGDRETYISGKGVVLEQIRSGQPVPSGIFISEDAPRHGMHRRLLNRVFTPNRMAALEVQIRDFCAKTLDPLVGSGGFDVIRDFGSKVPMRVIGMLLGIPEQDQEEVRQRADERLRTEEGKPMQYNQNDVGEGFDDYIELRINNPTDDIMSQLIHTEFDDDDNGTRRKLTRGELRNMIAILASAGNETTNRLIGWTCKLLGEHPEQRRDIARDRSLIPQAIEEILRFEPPADHIARYVARDVELYGTKILEGNVMIFLTGAANRDASEFERADEFDIHRPRRAHLTFGYGAHVCLGNALARVEGRIALDEILNRFPDWEVDLAKAKMASTSTVRGWDTLPVVIH